MQRDLLCRGSTQKNKGKYPTEAKWKKKDAHFKKILEKKKKTSLTKGNGGGGYLSRPRGQLSAKRGGPAQSSGILEEDAFTLHSLQGGEINVAKDNLVFAGSVQ